MKNLLELGKNLVKEMKDQYKDCFYRYVDENSFDDKTYISIGEVLFDKKEMFIDYMNHLYLEDFDWLDSEVNSFDFIQDLVDVKVEESKKYRWCDEEEAFVPVIEYSDELKNTYKDVFLNPCIIRNSTIGKEVHIKGYDDCDRGYNVLGEDGETLLFFEDKVDNVYNYIQSKLSMPTLEINGCLNLYLELDNSVWDAKDEDLDVKNRITKEKSNATDLLIDCLEELIENNPDTLKKYGLNQIIPNVHEVRVQEI